VVEDRLAEWCRLLRQSLTQVRGWANHIGPEDMFDGDYGRVLENAG
jgi:hypothetical protein